MSALQTQADILAHFADWPLDENWQNYLKVQSKRYLFLCQQVDSLMGQIRSEIAAESVRILDIGPRFESEILRQLYPEVTIHTLGFDEHMFQARSGEKHHVFDLNECKSPHKWPQIGTCNLIIMAEVVEHLYTAPTWILKWIRSLMTHNSFLIIQTPNACALGKRLRMLRGQHPYQLLREDDYPGHFREYTKNELIELGRQSRLKVVETSMNNYFDSGSIKDKIYNGVCDLLPGEFREGITMIFKKAD